MLLAPLTDTSSLSRAIRLTDVSLGLQTPRLKRLAEIVSAQAIAQQEKFEYGSVDGDGELGELGEVDDVDDGPGEPIEVAA